MIYYYKDFEEDFVKTKKQGKKIPENYQWIKRNPLQIFFGGIMFRIFKIYGYFYSKIILHLKIEGKEKIIDYKNNVNRRKTTQKYAKLGHSSITSRGGYYIYANHTLPLGDVFNPSLYSPAHPYYICDSSNLGIPVLGPILPYVGALPIPESVRGKKHLFDAISYRAKQGNAIIIYPEAHVWPYYTKIRPFTTTSFNFPIRDDLPAFTATTVFKTPKKERGRPRITIYIDGPFTPKGDNLTKKEKIKSIYEQVVNQMIARSKESDYEYHTYEKVVKEKTEKDESPKEKSSQKSKKTPTK